MNILEIIKENLPEGIEVSDKTLKMIEKEIKAAQGIEFVPKEQYSKKTTKIDELESELKEIQGKALDSDSYKEKFVLLEEEYKNYKQIAKTEFDDFKQATETEKATGLKMSQLEKQLAADGCDPQLVHSIKKEFDLEKVELDGEKIKSWEELSKPFKEQYSNAFSTVSIIGVKPITPPTNILETTDLFISGFDES